MVIKGKKVVGGKAEGEAIVCHEDFSFSSVDAKTGMVSEKGHAIDGQNIAEKVLVIPTGTGSTGGCYIIYDMAKVGSAPKAILAEKADEITATGAIMGNIPMIHGFDINPIEAIKTGDWLELDAEKAIVQIRSQI